MDLYLWSMLCYNCVHTILPQLPYLVLPWTWNDYIHCLVPYYSINRSWPGKLTNQKIQNLTIKFEIFIRYSKDMILEIMLQAENVTHTGPKKLVLYFTGATNILYTFGGHAVTV